MALFDQQGELEPRHYFFDDLGDCGVGLVAVEARVGQGVEELERIGDWQSGGGEILVLVCLVFGEPGFDIVVEGMLVAPEAQGTPSARQLEPRAVVRNPLADESLLPGCFGDAFQILQCHVFGDAVALAGQVEKLPRPRHQVQGPGYADSAFGSR